MPKIAENADAYANSRLGIFFPGVTPDLDGQCVSLVKWFMQEMSDVPNPQAARGDARYVGDTLVAQGLAVEVPSSDRKPGDIVVWKFGVYGHIAVLLKNDRVFEENVNVPGIASKTISDGTSSWKVYASRIGGLWDAWRPAPTFYRLLTYTEGGDMNDDAIRQTALYLRLAAGDSLEKANANNDNDLKQIKANIEYLPALAKQIYQGNELFRWKASHYDEQVKAAHDKGFQEGEAAQTGDQYVAVAEAGGKPTLFVKVPKTT